MHHPSYYAITSPKYTLDTSSEPYFLAFSIAGTVGLVGVGGRGKWPVGGPACLLGPPTLQAM